MEFRAVRQIALRYGRVDGDILANISGIASSGDHLWTVSDEGRTIERLMREGDGYRLGEQVAIDELISGIPGEDDELDLESVDVRAGRLWICGSHCVVRKKPKKGVPLNPDLRHRPSRQLLAAFQIDAETGALGDPQVLPFEGRGSLRAALATDPFLAPFMELPSKENGLDIEGLLAVRDGVLLGLRGPVVDSLAVVARVGLDERFRIGRVRLHFLDVAGLAVRDLARLGNRTLVLGGPVSDAPGPFRLFSWRPAATGRIDHPTPVCEWPINGEKPEGICALELAGKSGVLVVYDKPAPRRVSRGRYQADWMPVRL